MFPQNTTKLSPGPFINCLIVTSDSNQQQNILCRYLNVCWHVFAFSFNILLPWKQSSCQVRVRKVGANVAVSLTCLNVVETVVGIVKNVLLPTLQVSFNNSPGSCVSGMQHRQRISTNQSTTVSEGLVKIKTIQDRILIHSLFIFSRINHSYSSICLQYLHFAFHITGF